jgi:hypothetical protein
MALITEIVKPEIINKITGTGLGVTWFSFAWIWLGDNQAPIAACCTIMATLVTLYGVFRSKK